MLGSPVRQPSQVTPVQARLVLMRLLYYFVRAGLPLNYGCDSEAAFESRAARLGMLLAIGLCGRRPLQRRRVLLEPCGLRRT